MFQRESAVAACTENHPPAATAGHLLRKEGSRCRIFWRAFRTNHEQDASAPSTLAKFRKTYRTLVSDKTRPANEQIALVLENGYEQYLQELRKRRRSDGRPPRPCSVANRYTSTEDFLSRTRVALHRTLQGAAGDRRRGSYRVGEEDELLTLTSVHQQGPGWKAVFISGPQRASSHRPGAEGDRQRRGRAPSLVRSH